MHGQTHIKFPHKVRPHDAETIRISFKILSSCRFIAVGVFSMFRTSCVHHQEDHLCMHLFLWYVFSWIYVSCLAGGRMCSISSILTAVDWSCQLTSRPVDSRVCTDEAACLLQYWGLLMSVSHLSVVATYFSDLCTTWMGLLWYKFVACKNGRVCVCVCVCVCERERERERVRERDRQTVVYETAGKRKSERGHAVINSTSKVSESSRVVCYEEDPADGPYLYLCC